MLHNVRIVLVHPSHPGNIGAAARAMKTMGLSRLYLVQPQQFPHPEAIARASGAVDVLEQAVVTDTLVEAIGDCQWVFGTSARSRSLATTCINAREAAQQITVLPSATEIAIVFGEERIGLTNQEMDRCQFHIFIPTNPEYGSLNLASAVQIMCYELRMTATNLPTLTPQQAEIDATVAEMESFFTHLESILYLTDFIDPHHPKQLMSRLRRLYLRARPSQREINILRGILAAVEKLSHE